MFKVNPPENVQSVFADRLTESMIDKVNTHAAFAERFFNDSNFQKDVTDLMMEMVQKGFDLSDESVSCKKLRKVNQLDLNSNLASDTTVEKVKRRTK